MTDIAYFSSSETASVCCRGDLSTSFRLTLFACTPVEVTGRRWHYRGVSGSKIERCFELRRYAEEYRHGVVGSGVQEMRLIHRS